MNIQTGSKVDIKQGFPKFTPGQIVRFGGGPEMTVLKADPNGVHCGWFDLENRFNTCYFENDFVSALEPKGIGVEAQ